MEFSRYPKLREITKHTLSGVLQSTTKVFKTDHIMDFNNLRAQFNYLQALIYPFIQVPSFKRAQNLFFLPTASFRPNNYKQRNYFSHKLYKIINQTQNLARNFLTGTSKTFGIHSSYTLLNANKSLTCVLKISWRFIPQNLT